MTILEEIHERIAALRGPLLAARDEIAAALGGSPKRR